VDAKKEAGCCGVLDRGGVIRLFHPPYPKEEGGVKRTFSANLTRGRAVRGDPLGTAAKVYQGGFCITMRSTENKKTYKRGEGGGVDWDLHAVCKLRRWFPTRPTRPSPVDYPREGATSENSGDLTSRGKGSQRREGKGARVWFDRRQASPRGRGTLGRERRERS